MVLLLSVAVAAVAAGYLVGGRLRNLERIHLRWWGLAPLGFLLQLVPISGTSHGAHLLAIGLLIASYVLLLAFALVNVRLPGFALILIGLAMNATVITVNSGMPVGRQALVSSGEGGLLRDLIQHGGAKHHLAGPDDVLLPLADEIAVPAPFRQVMSAGDIVTYVGIVWLVAAAMRGRNRALDRTPGRHRRVSSGRSRSGFL